MILEGMALRAGRDREDEKCHRFGTLERQTALWGRNPSGAFFFIALAINFFRSHPGGLPAKQHGVPVILCLRQLDQILDIYSTRK